MPAHGSCTTTGGHARMVSAAADNQATRQQRYESHGNGAGLPCRFLDEVQELIDRRVIRVDRIDVEVRCSVLDADALPETWR